MTLKSSNLYIRLIAYASLLISILFSCAGQLLMKQSVMNPTEKFFTWSFLQQLGLALSIYTIGLANYIFALRFVKLSIAYPLSSLTYVGIILGSHYLFDEKITPVRIVGIFIIFIGVLFVIIPVTKHTHIKGDST